MHTHAQLNTISFKIVCKTSGREKIMEKYRWKKWYLYECLREFSWSHFSAGRLKWGHEWEVLQTLVVAIVIIVY